MRTRRHTLARLSVTLGLFGLGSATLAGSAGASTPTNVTVPGKVVAITQPLASGTMWVLSGTSTEKTMYQVNADTGAVLGSEGVSRYADDIALSANNATLALGTTAGAYPAMVWYSALTGRFAGAARATAPVFHVATNSAGNTIYDLRGGSVAMFMDAVGTSNGLGFSFPIPGSPVGLVLTDLGRVMLVLQADGTLGTLSLPGGKYVNAYSTGAPAQGMSLTGDGSTLYVLRAPVANSTSGSIAVVNVAAGKVIETIPTPVNCVSLAISPDGRTLFEALRSRGRGHTSTIRPVTAP
jgi:hypothetical protein